MSDEYTTPYLWLYKSDSARFGDLEHILVKAGWQKQAVELAVRFLDKTPYSLPENSAKDFKCIGTANYLDEPGVLLYAAWED